MSKVVPLHPHAEYVTEAQCRAIRAKIVATQANADLFLVCMKVPSVEEIPAHEYQRAIALLDARAARAQEPIPIAPPGRLPGERTPFMEFLNERLSPFDDRPVERAELFDLLADIHWYLTDGPDKPSTPPSARRAGGRPPKAFTARLAFFAGMWMEANASEVVADLVKAMEAECDFRGWEIGSTQLRELATQLMDDFQALRRRD
jgi:hypothetical protein